MLTVALSSLSGQWNPDVSSATAGAGPKDRLIDIGCGDGRFCVAAAQCAGVARAVGVEHDARLIARCRERAAACGLSADAVQFIEVCPWTWSTL